ncbi:MAG: ethylbenzene dehydrogenase-related protein [Sulfurimonadaceae bacterium]|jgi:complex iron-sulfur molybdoenzyme family reductase subunit gamma
MKKLVNSLLAAGAIATAVSASSAITAVKVNGNIDKVSYDSAVWKQAKMTTVTLYPQTTIAFNDKKANELNADAKAMTAQVGAIYNGSQIAFIMKWADGTKNVTYANTTDTYADGFAIQFASDAKNPKELPYIGMGSDGRPVVIHLQKEVYGSYEPNGNGDVAHQVNPNQTHLFGKELEAYNKHVRSLGSNDYEKTFVAEGFRSTTEIKDGSSKGYSRFGYANKGWSGTLSRPLKDAYVNLDAAAIPVAFAIWDGAKMNRNGLKYLTGWTAVKLEGKQGGNDLVEALHSKVGGDAAKGKEVAANNCSACHQLEKTDAPNLMGPSLTNIGGYASVDYLRESIVNPSAVVVPGYNRNAHSAYEWYTLDNGKRTSTMPEFSWLEQADMENLIAYLKTLKAEVK